MALGHGTPASQEQAQVQESPAANVADRTPYPVLRTREPLEIDGNLDEPGWSASPKSPRFVDMVNGRPGFLDTRAAAVWDDQCLYVAFWVSEPAVRASVTRRDDTVFRENDVEVFIDGIDSYYEFEINALNTIYEVFFVWRDAYERFAEFPEFSLRSTSVFSFGGNHDRGIESFWHGTHPRGPRWAFIDWDFPGLRSAVQIQGTLNEDGDFDQGWTVELAFPWAGMKHLAAGRTLPPKPGDRWRIFFGRFQKMQIGKNMVSPSWSWDAIGDTDNHMPERFTPVEFSSRSAERK